MEPVQSGCRFYFNNNCVIDQQVQSVSNVEIHLVVLERQRVLRLHEASALSQLVCKTSLIRTFQQSRAECRVNFHRGMDDFSTDRIDVQVM
jgi:hypothetical protein